MADVPAAAGIGVGGAEATHAEVEARAETEEEEEELVSTFFEDDLIEAHLDDEFLPEEDPLLGACLPPLPPTPLALLPCPALRSVGACLPAALPACQVPAELPTALRRVPRRGCRCVALRSLLSLSVYCPAMPCCAV